MYRLDNAEWMHLFWFLAIMLVLFVFSARWQRKALKTYGDFSVFGITAKQLSFFRPKLKFILFLLGVAFLTMAVVNPQIGSKLKEADRKGIDLMIAIDVSRSMDATDIKPSRLDRSRQSISRLIDELSGDRIGIIVFAGKSYTQLPITTDYSAAKMYLSTLSSDMVPTQGTSIGSAIELAMESFDDKEHSKSIIVITDGETHDKHALEKAEEAAESGITVHTIGMGLPEGVPIPIMQNGRRAGFKKDNEGNTVMTQLNEDLLSQIASRGNGSYVRANNARAGLQTIFDEINRMEKQKFESKVYADYEDRFQYFLALAIVLLIAELLLVNRKSRFAGRLNLFRKEEGND